MVFNSLLTAIECEKKVDMITVIDGTPNLYVGKMLVIHEDGRVEGQFDGPAAQCIVDKVRMMAWTKPVTFFAEDAAGGRYRMLWERVTNQFNAVVFGGGHISQPLVQILSLLDFLVTVVDDRLEFANQARFPGAHKVICETFQQSFNQLVINEDTAVIIVTRGHRYDMECLRATMDSKARYLGMIGSRKRVREVLGVLREEGASQEVEKRLRAPIGLDIRGETPAEIAVSIAAEVVSVFRGGGSGLALSGHKEAL